jgi:hypothetical protein
MVWIAVECPAPLQMLAGVFWKTLAIICMCDQPAMMLPQAGKMGGCRGERDEQYPLQSGLVTICWERRPVHTCGKIIQDWQSEGTALGTWQLYLIGINKTQILKLNLYCDFRSLQWQVILKLKLYIK